MGIVHFKIEVKQKCLYLEYHPEYLLINLLIVTQPGKLTFELLP